MEVHKTAKAEFLTNPEIFRINRLDAHSDHRYYKTLEAMQRGEDLQKVSLNGTWQFSFARNPQSRVANFYEEDYDGAGWDVIQVPGHIQLQGYEKPHYVNTMYPWDGHSAIHPPTIPHDYNPVGSYMRTFTVPKEWDKSSVYISFQGVESAFYLWVNGEFVGYSEDTFTPAEFDLSPFIHEGENKIAVEVYKWCSGSWLEDQDFWRLSGIFRDVYLYTIPKVHIQDMFIKTDLDETYTKAVLSNEIKLKYKEQQEVKVALALVDQEDTLISESQEVVTKEELLTLDLTAQDVRLWSAEEPNLYTLYVYVRDVQTGELIEVVPQKVGFRKFEMIDKVMHLNGKRIVFKGVNRHEFSCYHGRSVTKEEMLWDIKFLKQHNFNAVRTSHYPNASYWYELCDEYGIYLIDETNLESHGTWQNVKEDGTEFVVPDGKPEWLENVLDRAKSVLERDKNHPSVLIWSCGNEAYGGENIYKMSEYFRNTDPTRLVHYEGVFNDRRFNDTSDMESRMYSYVTEIEAYLNDQPEKPFILCEYSHAMGNSNGAIHKYTALEEKYPMYQGGFIWDYIDQGIMTKDRYGKEYLAFGGDFGDRPTDYNFCINGLVYADRKPSPKMQEVKFVYQDFKLEVEKDKVHLKNQSLFTNTNKFDLLWELKKEGVTIQKACISADVMPGTEETIALAVQEVTESGEYTLDVKLTLKEDEKWANRGHEVAFGQYIYTIDTKEIQEDMIPVQVEDCIVNVGIKGKDCHMIFSKAKGALVSLKYRGKEFINAMPMPNFWRAITDNDRGNELAQRCADWKIASLYAKHVDMVVEAKEYQATVAITYDLHTKPKAFCKVSYTVHGNGKMDIKMECTGHKELGHMPNYGLSFKIPADYENIEWYGNGKEETYSDRKYGARLGIFANKVVDNVSAYVIPQECGNKTEVRWAKIVDQQGFGIKVSAKKPFEISALPYTCHELENAYHHYDLPPIQHTVISVAKMQLGIGGDDSWGAPIHEEYRIPVDTPQVFEFTLEMTN